MVDSPSGRVPAKAPRWDLADTEGYGGGNLFHGAPGCFRGPWIYIGERSASVAARGAQETGGMPRRGGRALLSPGRLDCFLTCTPSPRITFIPKIMLPKVSFRLGSI